MGGFLQIKFWSVRAAKVLEVATTFDEGFAATSKTFAGAGTSTGR